MAHYTTERLVAELRRLLADIDRSGIQAVPKLMADVLGQVIENFRLRQEYSTQQRGRASHGLAHDRRIAMEADVSNLSLARQLHEEIMTRLASR